MIAFKVQELENMIPEIRQAISEDIKAGGEQASQNIVLLTEAEYWRLRRARSYTIDSLPDELRKEFLDGLESVANKPYEVE